MKDRDHATDPVPPAVAAPPQRPSPRLAPGDVVVDRYEVRAALGEGGAGAVFRVHDRALREDIALKVLDAERLHDEGAAERLRREVTLARKIAHPAVCRVFDVGDAPGFRFLTMELIDGKDLRDRLMAGPVPESEALAVLGDVCAGLHAAHAHGIVHRDLKPENVMLRAGGGAVVVDFGLALAPGTVRQTMVAGTPAYMSPEQLRGEPLDARSDVFACGLLAYEVLFGLPPFPGTSAAEVTSAILRDPPIPTGRPALDRVLARALAKSPAERYPTVTEFHAALLSSVHDERNAESNHAQPARPRRGVAGMRRVVALLALFMLVTSTLLYLRRFRAPARPAAPPAAAAPAAEAPPAVAVTRFVNATGDPALDPLAISATASARTGLGAFPRVRVTGDDPAATWRVHGELTRVGTRVRVTLTFGDVPAELDGDPADPAPLLDAVRDRALDEVRLAYREHERRARARRGTADPQAAQRLLAYYDLTGPVARAEHTGPGGKLLDEALARDPAYGPAHVEKALLLMVRASQRGGDADVTAAHAELDAAARTGAGPELHVARCRLAQFQLQSGGTSDAALFAATRACQDALEADPSSARVRLLLALLAEARCDDDLAMDMLDRALPLDRAYEGTILHHLTRLALQNHRLVPAGQLSERLVAFQEREMRERERALSARAGVRAIRGAHVMRAGVLLQQGRPADAERELRDELAAAAAGVADEWAEAAAIRGLVRLAASGRGKVEPALRARLGQLEAGFADAAAGSPSVAFRVSGGYQWVDRDAALSWLDKMAAPSSCDDALPRFILATAAGDHARARVAYEACQPGEDWSRSCARWMERQLPRPGSP